MKNSYNQKGSAIFFILIGVALFAALGFTVSNIMRSGDPNVLSDQKAQLYANEILDYTRSLRQSIQSVRISGCDDTDISFANSFVSGYAHTPSTSDSCKVFNADGGGISYLSPVTDWLDGAQSAKTFYGEWYIPASVCVPDIGTSGSGTGCNTDSSDNEDLILILPYVREDVCIQINESLDQGSSIPSESGNGWTVANTKYNGSFSDGERLDQNGLMSGCFQGSGSNTPGAGTYHFFQVLMPR